MKNRVIPAALLALLLILQGQLWFGRGSVPKVAQLEEELAAQQAQNAQTAQLVARLEAEIGDLREGLDMVEDRARSELGMVKPNEILVQIAK
ncbi:MAG: septation ring formation regulator EzrA [Betaproteobacteria bacterium]|jgi:cell division protein FtsB|nr:septation ring formation regulator EzrA [Betaproteobacteria bacterium]NBX04995.1 septation ring formation regulator EzrA [Betaproteobacteria bacterium]